MKKNSILIIEDEKYLLESIKELLSINGYNVYTADTGLKAIELLNDNYIDCVVSDVSLPDVSGYEILQHTKNSFTNYKIPFIFLSAYADENDIRKGMNQGADDYLTKPFKFQTLLDTISSRLKIHSDRNQIEESRLNDTLIKVLNNNFSHEFLTPLNGILSLSQIIENDTLSSSELKNFIKAIYFSGLRMYRNVKKLLLYSLIKTNTEIIYTKEDVQVSDLLQNLLSRSFSDYKLNSDVVKNICITKKSNELLQILFEEIIDNAIKYSELTSTPDVFLYKTNSCLYFKVSNVKSNTFTFTENDIKAFEKFHDDKTMNGLGLGLYISKHICSILGLEFTIENDNSTISIIVSSTCEK